MPTLSKTRAITLAISAGLVALSVSAPAAAGGYHGHHYRGHPQPVYRQPWASHHRHHHRHWRSDRYRYVGAGILLGAVASAVLRPRSYPAERVVYRGPIQSRAGSAPPPTQALGEPVPVQRHDVYLRRTADGECWLIETQENGDVIQTPQDPSTCF